MTSLFEVTNRQTLSWSKAQFNISTGIAEVLLIYDVIGETFVLGDGVIVAIDDITITNSSCGIFGKYFSNKFC